MAKKKVVLKQAKAALAGKQAVKSVTERRIDRLEVCSDQDVSAIEQLNQRIDNIVAAHEKCKSLKGL